MELRHAAQSRSGALQAPRSSSRPVVPAPRRPAVWVQVASASSDGASESSGPQNSMFTRFAAFAAGLGSTNNNGGQSSSPSQGPSRPRGAASSADAGAGSKRQASNDMLHRLSAGAHPSVIAAALVARRDATVPKGEFPPSVLGSRDEEPTAAVLPKADSKPATQAYAAKGANNKQANSNGAGTAVANKKGGAWSGSSSGGQPGRNGSGGGPQRGEPRDSTAVISAAELDSMLSGLRASLESIQESRSKYVKLLAERETTILELQAQLNHKSKQVQDLDSQLRECRQQLSAAQAAAAAAKAEAAAATQAALEAAEAAATAVAAVAAAQAPVQAAAAAAAAAAQAPAAPVIDVPPTPVDPPKPAPPKDIVLYYRTNWRQAFVHCSMDGKAWTTLPGIPLEHSGDVMTVRLPCSRIEFVFNDGKGQWDSPAGNYRIGSPGTYRVDRGRVDEV